MKRLVWSEGMLMLPQHLQQLDLYHEQLVDERVAALTPFSWGVREVALDDKALAAGTLRLLRCRAILPDGQVLAVAEGDAAAPPARPAEPHLPPHKASAEVFLALPTLRTSAPNLAQPNGGEAAGGARFVAQQARAADLNTGAGEQAVLYATPNLSLRFDDESLDGYDTIKIAEIARGPAGALAVRDEYVPPCLQIGASPYLINGLRNLLALMVARQKGLAAARRERGGSGSVEFGAADVQALWTLQALNGALAPLGHALESRTVSPETLYLELSRLAGQLLTFSVDADPANAIPRFHYLALGATFASLFELLGRLVSAQTQSRFVTIPLDQRQPGFYTGKIVDGSLLDGGVFYLAISGEVAEAVLRERLPRLVKVGSMDQISQIISASMPGVRVELDYRPPGAIPVRAGHVYFRLEKGGAYWDRIRSSGAIAIYQPLEPGRLKLELLATLEG
jgi:type VI secretion system protein ImpJ